MKKMNAKMKKEECTDRYCPFHGSIHTRGRNFKGYIKKIFGKRAVIEWERIVYYPKFERFAKSKSRIHAHIPGCIAESIKQGDYVSAVECRPLSKIIHFIITGKAEKK